MTKEEKIQKEWNDCSIPKKIEDLTGCYWYKCKRSQVEHLKEEFDFIIWDLKECSIRPKSLQGIENNNGWIKIESEEDLPKEFTKYWVIDKSDGKMYQREFDKSTKEFFLEYSTHYQPIVKPQPPIF